MRRQLVYASFLCVLAMSASRADYIITVGNVSVAAGSTAYVPVYIRSDSGQSLASTNFEFLITTAGATRLAFQDSPSPAADPTFSDSSYVFFGNSLDETFDLSLGTASLTTVPNDTFIGGDATADFSDVGLSTSDLLLAMLPVTAVTVLPPVAGDTFTIRLVPTSAAGFSGNTGFGDSGGQFGTFSSFAGSVTIVPEPSSWLMALAAAATLFGCWSRSRFRVGSFPSGTTSIESY